MNAKEYLKQKGWDEADETFCKALEEYHQLKSKEEAEERYEMAINLMPDIMLDISDAAKIQYALKIASGKSDKE